MFSAIVNVVVSGIAACFSWFERLIGSMSGALDFVLAFFAIYVIVRFILKPVLGGGRGSDKAKKSSGGNSGSSTESEE